MFLSISPCALHPWASSYSSLPKQDVHMGLIWKPYLEHIILILYQLSWARTSDIFCTSSLKALILLVLNSYYRWCNCSLQLLCYQWTEIFLPPSWASQKIKSQSFFMLSPCTVVFCRTGGRGSRIVHPPWSPLTSLSRHNPQGLLLCLGQNFDQHICRDSWILVWHLADLSWTFKTRYES